MLRTTRVAYPGPRANQIIASPGGRRRPRLASGNLFCVAVLALRPLAAMETCGAAVVNDIAVAWIPCQSILYTIFGYQTTGRGENIRLFRGFSEGEWRGGVAAHRRPEWRICDALPAFGASRQAIVDNITALCRCGIGKVGGDVWRTDGGAASAEGGSGRIRPDLVGTAGYCGRHACPAAA